MSTGIQCALFFREETPNPKQELNSTDETKVFNVPIQKTTSIINVLPSPENGNFSVYYQNVRGLRSKLRDFNCASLAENYDVLAITETWLSSDVCNNEILDARYSIYRNDKNALNSIKGRGGGIMLAVNSKYKSLQLINVDKEVEEIWVKIITGKRDLILWCVYLPPKSDLSKFSSHIFPLWGSQFTEYRVDSSRRFIRFGSV
jgi:hypothetical protein